MKRRQFIAYTGLTAAAVVAGSMFNPSLAGGIFDDQVDSNRGTITPARPRMNGGRCHDHRFAMGNPTRSFEKEIFGI